jgi:hypothetical protein
VCIKTNKDVVMISFIWFSARSYKHRRFRLYWTILIGTASIGQLHVAQAAIYRWTDDQGQVHFSDKAPANKTAEKATLGEMSGYQPPDEHLRFRPSSESGGTSKNRKLKAARTEREARDQQRKEKACESARTAYRRVTASATSSISSWRQKDSKRSDLREKIIRLCR